MSWFSNHDSSRRPNRQGDTRAAGLPPAWGVRSLIPALAPCGLCSTGPHAAAEVALTNSPPRAVHDSGVQIKRGPHTGCDPLSGPIVLGQTTRHCM